MNLLIEENEILIQQVLHDLESFLPNIVLVGGWLPYIYAKYVWQGVMERPVTTSDIDIAIRPGIIGENISQCLTRLHYHKKHLYFGKEVPYAFLILNEQNNMKIPLDLICAEKDLAEIEKVSGKDVIVSHFIGFEILYEDLLWTNVFGVRLAIPSPERYIFYKLKTFLTAVMSINAEKISTTFALYTKLTPITIL